MGGSRPLRTMVNVLTAFMLLSLWALSSAPPAGSAGTDAFSLLGLQTFRDAGQAPDFSLPALDGKTVGLKDYDDKVLMLYFWTTY